LEPLDKQDALLVDAGELSDKITLLMYQKIDYSLLDQPQILQFVFYPREDYSPPPRNAVDHSVPVQKDVSIGCRFYPTSKNAPSILYFHGNGEVVSDYDDVAPFYNRFNINLFVADYRGYGQSGGMPSFSNTVADSHVVFEYFRDTMKAAGYTGSLFVMGRSLGSLSATELAASYPMDLKGLIIESGFASAGKFLRYLDTFSSFTRLDEFEKANLDKLRSIAIPVLIIHGEWDEIIPFEQAEIFYQNVGSKDKRLLRILHAGHNDIMLAGLEQYFQAIKEFVSSK
jgi:alpha-beta hydrolase superfamily lysophospholipase